MYITELFENQFHTINEDTSMSDIIQARELINRALSDPSEKHQYFNFLKSLRNKHGVDYSTNIHQKASKLARDNT